MVTICGATLLGLARIRAYNNNATLPKILFAKGELPCDWSSQCSVCTRNDACTTGLQRPKVLVTTVFFTIHYLVDCFCDFLLQIAITFFGVALICRNAIDFVLILTNVTQALHLTKPPGLFWTYRLHSKKQKI